ncbi:predicted protein [Nematostella vectensis]|uniref:Fibronectin type-III domain-containing protein n=1 Tax=Nematostella vectensis TaxID=45351 RepID=A7RTI0_NEMVE|nr:predicted protein [Nematostella vectensis]|eukprot:XP_001637282.1 predicted protein [Nematostella vectensis]
MRGDWHMVYIYSFLDPVDSLRMVTVGARFVVLAWNQPQHPNGTKIGIKGYHLYKYTYSDRKLVNTTDLHQITVSGLQPGTAYRFSVAAYNEIGEGPAAYIAITTNGAQVGAPKNLNAYPLNSTAIQLKWQAPQGAPADERYYLYMGLDGASPSSMPFASTTKLSYVVMGLTESVVYEFEVSLGFAGEHSIPASARPVLDPVDSLRMVTVGARFVVLAWNQPQHPNGTKIGIKGYHLYKYTYSDRKLVNTTDLHQITVSGLHPGTAYRFSVAAYNEIGEGPAAYIAITTNGAQVGAPKNLNAYPLNSTAIQLKWQAPQGAPADERYYLYMGLDGASPSSMPFASTTKLSYVVMGLTDSVVYEFEVSLGFAGEHSIPASARPVLDPDKASVVNLKYRLVNVTTIVLSWQPPQSAKPADIQGSSKTITYKSMQPSQTIPYLPFSTTLKITIVMETTKGPSIPNFVMVTTGAFSASVAPLVCSLDFKTLKLKWAVPSSVDPLAVKDYLVSWTCSGNGCMEFSISHKIYVPSYSTMLNFDSTYQVSVRSEVSTSGENPRLGEISSCVVKVPTFSGKVKKVQYSLINNTLDITWQKPDGIPDKYIPGYSVSWCYQCDWEVNTTYVTETSVSVPSLMYGHTYHFYISINTTVGITQTYTFIFQVPTLDLQVSSLYAYTTRDIYATVYWYGPYVLPGKLTGFLVQWRNTYSSWQRVELPANQTRFSIWLQYGNAYIFQVTPMTMEGLGKDKQIPVSTPRFDGRVTDVTGYVENMTLHVSWTPAYPYGDYRFYYYSIKYQCVDCYASGMIYQTVYGGINSTNVSIPVMPGGTYKVGIASRSSVGYGSYVSHTFKIPALKGLKISNFEVHVHNNTARLSWSIPPRFNEYDFKGFQIMFNCTDCANQDPLIVHTNSTAYRATLLYGSAYAISIRGRTPGGDGETSMVTQVVSPLCSKVSGLSYKDCSQDRNDSAICLEWGRPIDGFLAQAYEIQIRQKGMFIEVFNYTVVKGTYPYKNKIDTTELKGEFQAIVRAMSPIGYGLKDSVTFQSHISPAPFRGARKSHSSPVVWAVPVAIVGLLLVLALAYFVRKSHRLENSMYALLTRNSGSGGDEVTFHRDEEDEPLIQGFSDDEPLVTA